MLKSSGIQVHGHHGDESEGGDDVDGTDNYEYGCSPAFRWSPCADDEFILVLMIATLCRLATAITTRITNKKCFEFNFLVLGTVASHCGGPRRKSGGDGKPNKYSQFISKFLFSQSNK